VLLRQRVFILSTARVREYLLSISDTSETITSMIKVPPNMALVCVPSCLVTNSQNVFTILAELSLTTLSIILPSETSPEEIIAFKLFKEINPVPKIPRKHKIEKTVNLFFTTKEANNIEEKRKMLRKNKVKE
jgi:hypothetical protein